MKKKVIYISIGIVVLLIGVIAATYAYFSQSGSQESANTFNSGCLNITLENESTSIKLTNTYPITDIEGLETTSYDFTIKNNCNSATNYSINLESLNQVSNTLGSKYIKVSLSSDSMDNVISLLSSNPSATPSIAGAYASNTLYTGTLNGNESKTYHLKLWIDYDATKEQAASKTYTSKINVIANPETTVTDTLEAKFTLEDKTLTSSLSSNVTSAKYCVSTSNICIANTSATITSNSYSVELSNNDNKQMVCTTLNNTSKLICSNPVEIGNETIADNIEGLYIDNQDMLAYDEANNLRYIGADPNNYVYFNCDDYNNSSSSTCELWRIIGVFSEDTHGISNTKLVKLIRNDSIGEYVWDSNNVNDWTTASLQSSLNTSYLGGTALGSGKGITTATNDMIETVTWKLGGTADYQSASNGLASHFYGYERGTTVYSGRPTTWSGKVGLMYPSDYGYATSGGSTTNRTACLAKELYNWDGTSDCYNNDWLFDSSGHQWTLTPDSSYSSYVFSVDLSGYVDSTHAYFSSGVRPSIYLKSNIAISGGSGTIEAPYVITD